MLSMQHVCPSVFFYGMCMFFGLSAMFSLSQKENLFLIMMMIYVHSGEFWCTTVSYMWRQLMSAESNRHKGQ